MNGLLYYPISILCICSGIAINTQAMGETYPKQDLREIKFIPPQDGEKPDTKGAGTRNPKNFGCSDRDSKITTIMPQNNYGLTTKEYPEIFIDLGNTSAKQVVLSFQDRAQQDHQVSFLPIQEKSSIRSFSLPKDTPGLETNRYYQWKLVLVCGDRLDVSDPVLSGWIKRQQPDINLGELAKKSTIQQANWYAQHGYWYDFLSQIKAIENSGLPKNTIIDIWQEINNKY